MSRSPNHGDRRGGLRPELVVIHYTAMPDAASAMRALCDPAREVSAHWLIARDGTVTALVDEERRAWHAGEGAWAGRGDVNSRSVGIELDNDGASPFAAPLMDALETLLEGILSRWSIPCEGVIGHSDMAPGRKRDPGPRFDWRRLARSGLAVWPAALPDAPDNAPVDADVFRRQAQSFGYPPMDDALLLRTFRLRFRPGARGPLDAIDCALAAGLVRD
ncbi:N-acetylmuramoyl-L-alanine amidase [Roseibacterium sp. SDUM158017]|uniref:N-acetylmuramoyl-L-alanine amidase n=1 Tax=Roseicyclus salinarum TaxID=3036773 RepID=UPI00241523BD|nr:N-acetylmuramoyl-L-alanine amidase [Roseibacterium sp. SDUM158017]MDG4649305.1 N-acetylmuramoyl-L-alanine amidase [Roseibacterium sp. SDUM158017]